ncbi:EF-hand domain-containing protein [Halomonas elongata]|uniref:EF-hand domain-containing protein n=1 Tax=Halomonas elongata (strain ATCC 33173 / DSM 2581 / NBRC 15536 / NCIMB 2198 / 1H9) TaxID=768066 RepID=E1VAV8_HALED|nr:EF-hand domain-containing protein [Halomonas elongata]WBF17811.1 hypothetical protein LM502_17365 [Halomonas elongata]WPU46656.1 hypothetical protein SR933_15615 [Halomonas elongata DSM 2581]CBV44057.1 uncharacterized protein HELO_4173 [Halomonas elongata DSM 2581]
MDKNFKTGLIITGNADGGVRAVRATSSEIRNLNRDFESGSKRARSYGHETRQTARELEFLKQHALGVGTAIAGAFAANNLAQQAVMIRNTDALANSLQVNTKTLQEWQFAGRSVGLEADKIGDIFKDVSDKLGDFAATGGGEAKDLFENLNLNIRELQALSPDKQILRIADAINEIEDPSQRSFYFESLADEMVRLQPLLANGAQGLREASDMADALGIAMDDIEVRRAVEAAEAMDQLQGVAQGLSNTLIADLGPGLADSTRSLTEFIDEVGGADEVLEGIGQTITMLGSVYLAVRLRKPLSKIGPLGLAAGRNIAQGFAMAVGASGRLNQALVVTQGRIAATAAAGRALRSSLALIGGPAGAALLAAGGIYTFREELGLTIPRADASSEAVHQLTGKLNDLNKAAAEKKLTELNNRLADLKASAEETGQAYLEVGKNDTGHGGFLGADVSGQVEKIQEIGEGAKESRQEMANVEEAIGLVRDRLEHLNSTGERTPPVLTNIGDASEDAAKKLEKQKEAAKSLLDELYPVLASQREYAEQKELLTQYAEREGKSNQWLEESLSRLQNQYRNAGSAAEVYGFDGSKAMEKVEDSVDPMATAFERGIERMDDAAVDMWRSFLDGSEGAFDSFKNLALDTLAEVIHAYTTRQITTSIGAQIGIGGQGASTAGGGGGFGNIASIGKQVYSGVVDGFSSVAWTGASNTAYAGGWAGSATSGIGQSGFMGGSLSNFGGSTGLMSLGASMIGSEVGDAVSGALTDKQANSNWGQMAGSAIGTYFGGPIGAGLGSALGSVVDSLFGSGGSDLDLAMVRGRDESAHTWDHGIVAQGGLGAVGFQDEGSHEVADLWDIDEAKQLVESIAQLDTAVASLAETPEQLAAMRDAVMASNRHGIQGHYGETSNPGDVVDRLTSRYDDAFGALDAEFAEFMQGLDGSIDQVLEKGIAARQAFTFLSDASERLDLRFNDTTASAYEAAASLAEAAGGVQNLSSLQQNYYQTLYSEEERLNQLRSDVTQQLNAMGMSLPTSREGFRQLVEAQNLNTEAGRENYVQLMQLVDSFDRLRESASSVNDETTDLADKISGLKDDVKSAWETFDKQSFDQRITLLEMAGKSEEALALQRERELATIDESLRPFQERIWALQDEAKAQEEAAQAGKEYAQALADAQSWLGSTLENITGWIDRNQSTDAGMGSPADQLAAAGEAYREQLEAARGGDRTALQNITQYADRFIAAQKQWSASGGDTTSLIDRIERQLGTLPDQLSAEEYIADEIKQALIEQTAGITSELADVLRSDTPSNIAGALASSFDDLTRGIGDVLTREQLATVMAGKATDAQLDAVMRVVDLNGDGVMSGLESVIIKSMPTDATLANALRQQLQANGDKALTAAQVRQALRPIASDKRINQLIRRVDTNGDGLLSAQELTSSRLGGLADGIAASLSGSFDQLDANLDDNLTFDELKDGLSGMATDAQLKALMRSMDVNADGVISGLESVVIESMPTDSRLANVLRNQLKWTRNQQLTHDQVREALRPIASDESISQLIRRLDTNGDGIITAQEVGNARLGGLADGIAASLSGSFDQLDANLDDNLTFAELKDGLSGMATDAQLKALMRSMDVNADGVISGLESVVIESMPTDSRLANVLRNQFKWTRNQQLTADQVRDALKGKASNDRINQLIRRADKNADGIIDAAELASDVTTSELSSVLAKQLGWTRNQIKWTRNSQLTADQVRDALKGKASNERINQLIRRADKNADGIIDAAELASDVTTSELSGVLAKQLGWTRDQIKWTRNSQLTANQVRDALKGKASNDRINQMIRRADKNADGIIDATELASDASTSELSQVLSNQLKWTRNQIKWTRNSQLTHDQVREALSPIASNAEIDRLITRLDKNSDGIISAQEMASERLDGLASGIGNALSPMFDTIDRSLDGLIDYDEFGKSFAGMASDEQLKRIFAQLDKNGDGTISRLEAMKGSTDEVGDNTASIEQQSLNQLEKLNNLVGEMTRTTDQFVDMNSTMVSLRDSINALGVAQEEQNRIERERREAKERQEKRLEKERAAASYLDRANQLEQQAQDKTLFDNLDGITAKRSDVIVGNIMDQAGNDNILSWKEYQSALDDMKDRRDKGWYNAGELDFAKTAALSLRKQSRYHEMMDQAAGITGDDYSGSIDRPDFAGVREELKGLSDIERARSFFTRYSDYAGSWKIWRGTLDYDWDRWTGNILTTPIADADLIRVAKELDRDFAGPKRFFAKGGVFTNSVVDQPTMFNMGVMGEAGPEAVMPLANGPEGLGIRLYDTPPIPELPLLGRDDIAETLRDVLRENRQLRKDLNRLMGENNEHAAAGVAVSQEGFKRVDRNTARIAETNDAIDDRQRLEAQR